MMPHLSEAEIQALLARNRKHQRSTAVAAQRTGFERLGTGLQGKAIYHRTLGYPAGTGADRRCIYE